MSRTDLQVAAHRMARTLAQLVPKRRGRVAFISRFGDYDGNVRYFCEFVRSRAGESEPALEQPVFVTARGRRGPGPSERTGLRVLRYPSVRAAWVLLRCRVVVVDGNEWGRQLKAPLTDAAVRIQLWHGSGIKMIGRIRTREVAGDEMLPDWVRPENTRYDLVTFTSSHQLDMRRDAFNGRRYLVNGYPRNDILFCEELWDRHAAEDPALRSLAEVRRSGTPVVLYAPTWRHRPLPSNVVDAATLNRLAGEIGCHIVIKLHPKDGTTLDAAGCERLEMLDATADIYPYLAISDVLVTDYSSVFTDFLLTRRPIVFFAFDVDDYTRGERTLAVDYRSEMPGPVAESHDQLRAALDAAVSDGLTAYGARRERALAKYHQYVDGDSSGRLLRELLAMVQPGTTS